MSPGVVYQCREANDYFLVSYDRYDKIVSVEIFGVSKLLCCHPFDSSEILDNKPPLSLYPIYYKECDELKVFLIDSEVPSITFQKTEEKDCEVRLNDKGNIVLLLFHNASSRLAEMLPEKEREILAEEERLISLEIAKYIFLYIK